MAERRMFAKTIVLSDAFLDMSLGARCLYMTLGMVADDDGFVNNPRSIMRQCGATDDDMKLLIAKRFVLLFDDGVIVIKHWRINNYLRADRYTETKYREDKDLLSVEDNGSYTLKDCAGIPTGIPNMVYPGKDSIDKDSIDKDIESTLFISDERQTNRSPRKEKYRDEFESLWKLYPRKQGDKKKAYKSYAESITKKETTYEEVKAAIVGYIEWLKAYKKWGTDYVALGSTWFVQKRWTDDYTIYKKPSTLDIAEHVDLSDF